MYQIDKNFCPAPATRVYSPTSLGDLIAWLGTQPKNREYDWDDIHGCLGCAYFEEACGAARGALRKNGIFYDAPFGTLDRYHAVCEVRPWTMGAALERALKLSN